MDLSDTERIATIEALISEECILLPMSLNIFYKKKNTTIKILHDHLFIVSSIVFVYHTGNSVLPSIEKEECLKVL